MMTGVNWSGFYLGANVGGSWGDTSHSFKPAGVSTGDFGLSGALGGGTLGFNWQLNPSWVLGVEGDFDGAGISGTKNCPAVTVGTALCRSNDDWLGSARLRLGVNPGAGPLLWYITGGAAFGGVNAALDGNGRVRASSTNVGWTAGAGAEYMFAPGWSGKLEYRYIDLGDLSYNCPTAICTTAQSVKAKFDSSNAILLGVNYHFGAPPPPPPPMPVAAPPPPAPKVFIVFFDWDKDTITRDGMAIIQQAAAAYQSGAPVQIQVTGYTDRSGSPGYNQRLSERRANNVAKALAGMGVPRTQMAVSGRGENDNRVPTADGVREPQNRRVEIVAP
jgi:opacity protein-like surface antigen